MTPERLDVVTFTRPYMDADLVMTSRSEGVQISRVMSLIFRPFRGLVWVLIGVAYVATAITMSLIARESQYGWRKTFRRGSAGANRVQADAFSISNTFWFLLGALVWQGYTHRPRALSAKVVVVSWWFFSLIIVSCYIANLTFFFIMASHVTQDQPITSVHDVLHQSKFSAGYIKGGSTEYFLRNSKVPAFKELAQKIEDEDTFVTTADEGFDTVRAENFVLITDKPLAEYAAGVAPCELTIGPSILAKNFFSLAVRPKFPHSKAIDQAITSLVEDGTVGLLKNKWWKGQCLPQSISLQGDTNASLTLPKPLGLDVVGSVFLLMACGIILGIIVMFVENCCFKYKERRRKNRKDPERRSRRPLHVGASGQEPQQIEQTDV